MRAWFINLQKTPLTAWVITTDNVYITASLRKQNYKIDINY